MTTVVVLRENTGREGRAPTGLAALRMRTSDQARRTVLDVVRCAMLPLRGDAVTGRDDDLTAIGADDLPDPLGALRGLDLAPIPASGSLPQAGCPPRCPGGRRRTPGLGGHAIGVALGQATRALPGIVTALSRGPVEGARVLHLRSRVSTHSQDVLDWRFVALAR